MNQEQLLLNAAREIKNLRSENQLMAARLQMFDDMMTVFNTIPQRQGFACSPDICTDLEKAAEAIKLERERKVGVYNQ